MSRTRVKIALDATPLAEPSGGIARYTAELARALAAEFPEDEYVLVSDQPGLGVARPPSNAVARRWWLFGLPWELRRLGAGLFHGTDFTVPYLRTLPSVLTLHDCSPWLEGELRQTAAERIRRRTRWALRAATLILTPSEAVRGEAIERFHLSPARVLAVPLAASEVFRRVAESEAAPVLGRLGINKPYLLFAGTRDRRKNLGRLVEAWQAARRVRPGLGLVLAGRAVPDCDPLPAEDGLVVTGRLEDPEIAALMSGAELFVYPSLYEGFGLPVLEAMQAGAPVVISEDAALRETAGGAAAVADARSTAALARAIVEWTGDPLRRRELRERGSERAAQFSWRRTARLTRQVYVEALRRF